MKVGYFVPCYVDAFAPQAAISTYNLIRRFTPDVEFIEQASCCALPMTDMGYTKKACAMERDLTPLLAPYDVVVTSSGICTDQIRNTFDSVEQTPEVQRVRKSIFDIVEFLHDVVQVKELPWAKFPAKVCLHNGCHSLRYLLHARPQELMIPPFSKPEALLNMVEGLEVVYATRHAECCGFGGAFSVWDPSCSGRMGLDKVEDYSRNRYTYITSADFSCLLHQQTCARKFGIDITTYYIAEILNGDAKL